MSVFIQICEIQTEALRRRREAGVMQWTEKGLRSCFYACLYAFREVFSKLRELTQPRVVPYGRFLYNT